MSWKLAVMATGERNWSYSGMRFGTKEEALDYGLDLESRWSAVEKYEAQTSDDPVNYSFKNFELKSLNPLMLPHRDWRRNPDIKRNNIEIPSRRFNAPYEAMIWEREARKWGEKYYICPLCEYETDSLYTYALTEGEADTNFRLREGYCGDCLAKKISNKFWKIIVTGT